MRGVTRLGLASLLVVGACNELGNEVEEPTSGGSATSVGATGTGPGPSSGPSTMTATMGGSGTSNGPGPTSLDGTTDGGATNTDAATTDETDTNDPTTTGTTTGSTGEESTGEPAECHPILAEVQYDPMGGEDNRQWVKLYNRCDSNIDLNGYSLGWGGNDYKYGSLNLQGIVVAHGCIVVGGPTSDGGNADPVFGFAADFNPDLLRSGGMDSGGPADGVALFDDIETNVMPNTTPVDAVIYGDENDDNLLDAEGDTPDPHVGDAGSGDSIVRSDLDNWNVLDNPTPNVCPVF